MSRPGVRLSPRLKVLQRESTKSEIEIFEREEIIFLFKEVANESAVSSPRISTLSGT